MTPSRETQIVARARRFVDTFRSAMDGPLSFMDEHYCHRGGIDWGQLTEEAAYILEMEESKAVWLFDLFEACAEHAPMEHVEVADCWDFALQHTFPGAWRQVERERISAAHGQLELPL